MQVELDGDAGGAGWSPDLDFEIYMNEAVVRPIIGQTIP